MRNRFDQSLTRTLVLAATAALFWEGVCLFSGVNEPWDSAAYWWLWYPMSIGFAAAAGPLLARRGWSAGLIITFAQLPVMWAKSGTGELWILGIALCVALAVPSVAASALTAWLAKSCSRLRTSQPEL